MSPTGTVNPSAPSRTGVFGGTFDPIHLGHLIAAEDVRSQLGLERMLFVPNSYPPHKQDREVTPVDDRVAMVRLGIASNPSFRLDLTEVDRPGPSFAVETMRALRSGGADADEPVFVLGGDALFGLSEWHEPDRFIAENVIVVMDRPIGDASPGRDAASWDALRARFPSISERLMPVHVARIGISAHDIRNRVAEGRSIRYLVPDAVADYIAERGLYR